MMSRVESELNPVLITTLAKIPGLSYFANFYWKIIHTADDRALEYPMMHNPDIAASFVLSYLILTLMVGPKYMRNRQPCGMVQRLLCYYNFITISVNGFLALALTHHVLSMNYSFLCEPLEPEGNNAKWVMTLLYFFHLSKILELIDTVFLVWKKKNNQLSFLHLYHHSTIIPATWIGVKFAPGGTTAIIAMVNSWVHVFMYVYYQMTATNMKISRKYKKFMTMIQITQFCYTLVVCSVGLWVNRCNYPEWILWWLFLYMLSFLVLFGKFFYVTYSRDGSRKAQPKFNGNNVHFPITAPTNQKDGNGIAHPVKNGALVRDDLYNGWIPSSLADNSQKINSSSNISKDTSSKNDQKMRTAISMTEPRQEVESIHATSKTRKPRKKKSGKRKTKG